MSTLDPAFDAELAKDAATLFVAAEIVLPAVTLRLLLDASDEVVIAGHTFTGQDDTYGILTGMDVISDGVDTQAPRLILSIAPPTVEAAATICDPAGQGGAVTVLVGAVDPLTGLVIGVVDTWFAGSLDVPTLSVDQGSRVVEYEVASVQERFFDDDEGARLSNAFHQLVWPGELGLEYVTEVQRQLPWGSDAPRPVNVTDISGSLNQIAAFSGLNISF